MRIKLENPIEFFRKILEENKITLHKLSRKVKVNYSTLKKYSRGELTIPGPLFELLILLCDDKEVWLKNSQKFEDNWGSSKAGKISVLNNNMDERIIHARKFKKIKKVSLKIDKFFCEFYGALMGDGCISKFKDWEDKERIVIYISGNKELNSNYLKYLQNRIRREFKVYVYFYEYKNQNLCFLSIKHKDLASFLSKFGFPIGLKYGKLKIPKKILHLPWGTKKRLIRGLFDTDGSICAKKREDYKYPQISISSKDQIVLKQLYSLLKERGYPCWISGDNISIRGIGCVKKWMSDIGSSNNRNIFKYEYWLKNKMLPSKLGPMVQR